MEDGGERLKERERRRRRRRKREGMVMVVEEKGGGFFSIFLIFLLEVFEIYLKCFWGRFYSSVILEKLGVCLVKGFENYRMK